ncbi:hypothetical protein CC86DRAFT_143102 [Ophiobolus disseminans]|uniref:Uncharacterized protein n=1 Tax=Ophiobolus disseminans TaxID=1469910 RepID=A0A6A7AF25_9PLEO|nr:hypothetical protein CC86DRAFT_143102 [Ophiobolus disseminans]
MFACVAATTSGSVASVAQTEIRKNDSSHYHSGTRSRALLLISLPPLHLARLERCFAVVLQVNTPLLLLLGDTCKKMRTSGI